MLRWHWINLRSFAPVAAVIQVMIGVGTVFGFGFLLPDVDSRIAAYLVTGGTTVSLVTLGIAVLPSQVAQSRQSGQFDYIKTLVPYPASYPLTQLAVLFAVSTPGMVLALALARWRFGTSLSISPMLLPVAILVSTTAAGIGYSIAVIARNIAITSLLSSLALFVVLLFSPVNYPRSHLPAWLQEVHRWAPFAAMADLVRWTTLRHGPTYDIGPWPWREFAVLVAWLAITLLTALRLAGRRR